MTSCKRHWSGCSSANIKKETSDTKHGLTRCSFVQKVEHCVNFICYFTKWITVAYCQDFFHCRWLLRLEWNGLDWNGMDVDVPLDESVHQLNECNLNVDIHVNHITTRHQIRTLFPPGFIHHSHPYLIRDSFFFSVQTFLQLFSSARDEALTQNGAENSSSSF